MKLLTPMLIVSTLICSLVEAKSLVLSSPKGAALHHASVLVLKEAYKKINVPVTFKEQPGARSLKTANAGKVDGEVTRINAVKKKFKNLVQIPVAINYLEGVVFTKDKTFKVNGWKSIKPYKIGIVRGSKFVEKGTKGMNTHVVASYKIAFNLLNKGKVDIVVAPYLAGYVNLKKMNLKNIKALKPAIVKLDLFHYLHKKHAGLVDKLKVELTKMKKDGSIKKIRKDFVSKL